MARGGQLTKLKSVLKKWNSFSKLGRPTSGSSTMSSSAAAASCHSSSDQELSSSSPSSYNITRDHLYPVYVGKSRRRYLVSSDVIDNPVFRELVERSGCNKAAREDSDSVIRIGCEVVLFEHLLWMLENADEEESQPESLHDLVEYYAC